VNVDEHILEILATTRRRLRIVGDRAGRLDISPTVVLPAARRLVDDGPAGPSFVQVHGIRTLYGLLPRLTAKGA
jgi:hypothetical protein